MKNISFNELINLDSTHPNKIIFVLFGHSNCKYCPQAKQILSQLNTETFYCDTMQNPQVVQWVAIRSVPLIIVIKNGIVVQRFTGLKSLSDYKTILKELLKRKQK